jgi:hypothetical protein
VAWLASMDRSLCVVPDAITQTRYDYGVRC